jgi:exonuclease SbcD
MSSTTFRFVHAADLHLDAPFHGLRRTSPAITQALGQAPLAAWDALVQLTIDQNAAFLLLAGDICDGAERTIRAQARLLAGLQRLAAHGIRTFIVRGDEDPAGLWPGIRQWPDLVHCFGAHDIESVRVTVAGATVATIHGISHSVGKPTNHARRFRRGPDAGLHIGLLHASMGRIGEVAACDHCELGDLETSGMDYWALGHHHRYQRYSDRRPWIVYPGTLQGRSLHGDETGPKGAVVVTVTDGAIDSATSHALDAVRLTRAEVDTANLATSSDLRQVLPAVATRLRGEAQGRPVVACALLQGRRPAWAGPRLVNSLWDEVLQDARRDQTGEQPFVWWDSVLDMMDPCEIRVRSDLSAHLGRLVDAMRRNPDRLEQLLADHDVPFAGPATLAGPPILDSIALDDLLTSAETLALDLLECEPS